MLEYNLTSGVIQLMYPIGNLCHRFKNIFHAINQKRCLCQQPSKSPSSLVGDLANGSEKCGF